jgi:hypothetical protein
MSISVLRERLRRFTEHQVSCRGHALVRLQGRMINHQDLIKHIICPEKLYKAVKCDSLYANEEKYKLYFSESRRYDLVVVMVFQNNHIEVITTYIKNKSIGPKILHPK